MSFSHPLLVHQYVSLSFQLISFPSDLTFAYWLSAPSPPHTLENKDLICLIPSVTDVSAWHRVGGQYLLLSELHLGPPPTRNELFILSSALHLPCLSLCLLSLISALWSVHSAFGRVSLCSHPRPTREWPFIPYAITIISSALLPPGRKPAVLISFCSHCPPACLSLIALHSQVRTAVGEPSPSGRGEIVHIGCE